MEHKITQVRISKTTLRALHKRADYYGMRITPLLELIVKSALGLKLTEAEQDIYLVLSRKEKGRPRKGGK